MFSKLIEMAAEPSPVNLDSDTDESLEVFFGLGGFVRGKTLFYVEGYESFE